MSSTDNTDSLAPCMTRRGFLLAGGAAIALASVPGLSYALEGKVITYPRKKIATLSELKNDTPITFRYPEDSIHFSNFIVKLNAEAGKGVGVHNDIVAFNSFCPHMGGPLTGVYNKEYKVAGPCPLHLTTFDLTRHGMVISGHATQSLPQILLEIEGNNIYATGVLGLVYGLNENSTGANNLIEVSSV